MSYYIIIRGPLGSGKSTLSRKLAQQLGAEYIGIDEMLEKNNLDTIPPGEPCIPASNFIQANEIIIPIAKEKLSGGTIVIFDGNFYHKEAIEYLIEHLDYPHYVFTLKVPVEICIERDKQREKTYGEGAAYAVHGLVSKFDYGTVVDASTTLEKTLKTIVSYLPKHE